MDLRFKPKMSDYINNVITSLCSQVNFIPDSGKYIFAVIEKSIWPKPDIICQGNFTGDLFESSGILISKGIVKEKTIIACLKPPSDNRYFMVKEELYNMVNEQKNKEWKVFCCKVRHSPNGNIMNWNELQETGEQQCVPMVYVPKILIKS